MPSQNIQWFPGHMAKTKRLIASNLPLVDMIVEIVDARIPASSRNPQFESLLRQKPRLILLNKSDSADEKKTALWCAYFKGKGITALPTDCKNGKGLSEFTAKAKEVLKPQLERQAAKGMVGRPIRIMVVGVPNVGKSSFINRMAGSRKTKVEDRPGVTRGKQWIGLSNGFDLLDMPGVLWPKFENRKTGLHLAFVGSIKDQIMDIESLATELIGALKGEYLPLICKRYSLEEPQLAGLSPHEILEAIARKRGMLLTGNEADLERASIMLLDEFRAAKIGRITLESPS